MHYVAILGAPATGKSTLARALASLFACERFRLRQWTPLTALIDPKSGAARDWLEDDVVHCAVRSFLDRVAHSDRTDTSYGFVTDNFPGTCGQVHLLHELVSGQFGSSHGTYLFLDADAPFLARRANERRVCETCEADPLVDARLPAARSPLRADACRECGSELTRRPNDTPALFAMRLRRYQSYESGIRDAVASAGARLFDLDASLPESDLVQAFQSYARGGYGS